MEGEEDADEHYGVKNDDFIDAADDDSPEDPPDLVDCGSGVDTAVVRSNDIVRGNCENVTEVMAITTGPDSGTTAEEQQQQREAFLSGGGG